jgi:hypothetical protein
VLYLHDRGSTPAKVGCASCRFGSAAKYLRPMVLLHALVALGMVLDELVAVGMVLLHALVAAGMVLLHAVVALGEPTGGGPATGVRAELVGVSQGGG